MDSVVLPLNKIFLNALFHSPQLPKLFPNMLMELQVYARNVPIFSFQADKVTMEFPGAVKAFAIQPNASRTPLFKLNVVS